MITENNKLIAEFMGWENYVNDGVLQLYKKENKVRALGQLYFNSDWNWLMEVVGKIIQTGDNTDQWDNVLNELQSVVIENVYNACIEFIKWYNQQTK